MLKIIPLGDTAGDTAKRHFRRSRWSNLWISRHGIYYARLQLGGKGQWKSLRTKITKRAKDRLPEVLMQMGIRLSRNLKLGECVEAYLAGKRVEGIKPLSLKYCELSVKMVRANFKGFDAKLAGEFTPHDAKVIADRLRGKYSKRRFNGALWTLRAILEVAVLAKVIPENPAAAIKPFKLEQNARDLPSDEKFYELIECLGRNHRLKNSLAFVRILALTGHRPESIRRLRAEHVDLAKRVVRWPPIKHKTDFNRIPMSDELYEILDELMRTHSGDGPLLPLKDPRKALETASKLVGISPPIRPGAFRHFWSSRAMERDIPIHVIAAMRGDRDGGRTLLKTYGHLRAAHVLEMVARLPGTSLRKALPACLPRRSGAAAER